MFNINEKHYYCIKKGVIHHAQCSFTCRVRELLLLFGTATGNVFQINDSNKFITIKRMKFKMMRSLISKTIMFKRPYPEMMVSQYSSMPFHILGLLLISVTHPPWKPDEWVSCPSSPIPRQSTMGR